MKITAKTAQELSDLYCLDAVYNNIRQQAYQGFVRTSGTFLFTEKECHVLIEDGFTLIAEYGGHVVSWGRT